MPKLAFINAKIGVEHVLQLKTIKKTIIAYMAKASRDRNTDISSVFIGSYYDEDLNENKWVDGLKYNDIQPNKVGKLLLAELKGLYPYSMICIKKCYILNNPPTQDSSSI